MEGVLKKISGLKIPDLTVAELLSISPSVAEGMKKWVSWQRVEIGPDELKVSSGTLMKDSGGTDPPSDSNLYSCPLGFLPCSLGDSSKAVSLLVNSGSQLNLILDAMACKLNISPRVSFNSAFHGIGNQSYFGATLMFSDQVGERILLPDADGRNIEVPLCSLDSDCWERDFPGFSPKLVLKGKQKDSSNSSHFLAE